MVTHKDIKAWLEGLIETSQKYRSGAVGWKVEGRRSESVQRGAVKRSGKTYG